MVLSLPLSRPRGKKTKCWVDSWTRRTLCHDTRYWNVSKQWRISSWIDSVSWINSFQKNLWPKQQKWINSWFLVRINTALKKTKWKREARCLPGSISLYLAVNPLCFSTRPWQGLFPLAWASESRVLAWEAERQGNLQTKWRGHYLTPERKISLKLPLSSALPWTLPSFLHRNAH